MFAASLDQEVSIRSIQTRRWIVVTLAFAAIMLNYVDRQVIAILKPTLQAQFHWSNRDYSHMASAYQFSAAIAFLGTGWFIDRVGLRKGFAAGVGVWSLAGMLHAIVTSVSAFVGARVLLGVAEAVGTPAQVKTAAAYFPPQQRSMLIGVGNMASNLGAVAAPLAIPPLALWLGWRAAFLVTGGLGLVWVVVWLSVRMPPEIEGATTEGVRVPWGSLPARPSPMGAHRRQNVLGRGLVVSALLRPGPLQPALRPESGHARPAGSLHLPDGGARIAPRRLAAVAAACPRHQLQSRAQRLASLVRPS